MCDPVSIGLGLLTVATVDGAEKQRKAASRQRSDAERTVLEDAQAKAKSEADAVLAVNARTASTRQRRRGVTPEVGAPSVLSTGATQAPGGGMLGDVVAGLGRSASSLANVPVLARGRSTAPAAPAPRYQKPFGG